MAETMRFEHRMSDSDALMWNIEKDPLLRSTIVSLLVLDAEPDHDRLVDKFDRASRAIPRLRQRVMANTFSIAPPRWETDPNFELGYHLRFFGCPGQGSLADVLSVVQPMSMQGFDRARPLWEALVVEGMAGGRAAVIIKLHHSITDGVGAVKLGMHLFDLEPQPGELGSSPAEPEVHVLTQIERVRDAWRHEQRRGLGIARRVAPTMAGGLTRLARSPRQTTRRVGEVATSVGRMLAPAGAPLSPIMTERSLSVRLDTHSVPLADAKAAAKVAGGRLNDFFLAGVLGGLRRYHDHHGVDPQLLRMGMPISVRGDDTADLAGNQFVPVRFLVPLQILDPAERMRALRELVAHQRAEPALELVDALSLVVRRLPTAAQVGLLGSMMRAVDVITSNVPGVPVPLYMGGARMVTQFPFAPRSGAAVNVTLLSYLDQLHIGVNADPAAVPDHATFNACLQDGFDEVLKA